MNIGYLTSVYARAGDTFIRGEVEQLRILGHTVHTFSVRRPDPRELVTEGIRREHAGTDYLLDAGKLRLALAGVSAALGSPRRMSRAVGLALRIGTAGIKGRLWPFAYLLEAAYLARRLEEREIQHLHNHIGEGSAAVALLASTLSGIPYSITVHGPGEFDRPTLLALGEKIRGAAFVVAVSEYGRSQLFRWCDLEDWPKVEVVHCGVDETFLGREPSPMTEDRRLICVGRLAEQKGQLILVEAAGRLHAEGMDFQVVLVGDGPMRPQIEGEIRRLNLGEKVRLVGWLGSEDVRREILRSRALVLPSFAEGLPVVIMESLALGRPVISTYVAGIPELVRPGLCGWLVPPGSVDGLVESMREALTAPSDRLEAMGRDGALRVAQGHDAGVEAGKLARLIARHSTLAEHAGPHARPSEMQVARS